MEWRKRISGLVPGYMGSKSVTIIGCGSVGSFIAHELARSGVSRFNLIDPDQVEPENLTRTTYKFSDVGSNKSDVLCSQLASILPHIEANSYPKRLETVELNGLIASSDLVIGCVDDPSTNGYIDVHFYPSFKPTIFVGLYKGAMGGEVVITLTGMTPCLHCSTGGVRKVADEAGLDRVRRAVQDYGTNRLVAEVALGCDIHLVCCAAAKIALSALCSNNETRLGAFISSQITQGCNYLILGMEPDYYLFKNTHEYAVGQYAYQSIWAKTSKDPECEVCGGYV